MKYYWNKFKDDYVVGLLSKWIDPKVLRKFQTKFPKFVDLLQWEQRFRREKVTVHPAPGSGPEKSVVDDMPQAWKKLPDIRDFAIKIRPYDWLFLLFGLLKRFPPKLQFWKWKNAKKNNYVSYMFARLRKQVQIGEYEAAANTMWILMNSSSYLDMGYNYVVRNWHRKRPLWLVEKELKEVKLLIRERATKIKFVRVYLDEVTKLRPLGVPTVPWRVYLHMYNNLLTEWRMVSEKGNQHGYLPGLGVLTAWEKLIKMLNNPNLFEADFKGFFDNVTHDGIATVLIDHLHLPIGQCRFIRKLNSSTVTLPEPLKLQEPLADLMAGMDEEYEAWLNGTGSLSKMGLYMRWYGGKFMSDSPLAVKLKFFPPAEKKFLPDVPKTEGVPQGAPTSCSIATLCLRDIELRMKCVLYADDGIYSPATSSDEEIGKVEDPEKGVRLNPNKWKWLKKDGKWVVEKFKFLGITYYPPKIVTARIPYRWPGRPWLDEILNKLWGPRLVRIEGYFEATTRNGASLKFTHRESLLSYLSVARDRMLQTNGSPGKEYFMDRPLKEWIAWNTGEWSNLRNKCMLLWDNRQTGWLVARMYVNSWSLKIKQNFHLSYRKDSWMGLRWPVYANYHGLNWDSITVFTASSFASDDLAYLIENPLKAKKRLKLKFRRVYHGRKPDRKDSLLSWFRLWNFK